MWLTTEQLAVTAKDVRKNAVDEDGVYFIHRGTGEHTSGRDCWCMPMSITGAAAQARPLYDIQFELDGFFSVN